MSDEPEFSHVTTEAAVQTYRASVPIFDGILKEVRELSKKKPEATMSSSKVALVNKVLVDLLTFLSAEPAGKYLAALDIDALPQMSDAVLTMVQFESALASFRGRYNKNVHGGRYWITEELLAQWDEGESEDDDDDDEQDEDEDERQ